MGIGMLFGEIRVAESLALVVKPESSLMRERERRFRDISECRENDYQPLKKSQ